MNAERLLQHYEKIAEAPDAITRLRRFVLDLAVRGKIVRQEAGDEPASELLKRIAKERARLLKTGEVRKSEIDQQREGNSPFAIPSNWSWTRLGSIADWGSGSTPSRGNADFYGGGITWLKSGELNDNRALAGSEETITQLAIDKGSFRQNRPGDVLIAMYGATIGKAAILAENAVTNQAVCGCTPYAGVFNQFIFLFLLSHREQFRLASEGGAQPNISKVKIVRTLVPLPPLAEQHRIVTRVDALMGLCDQLEAARAAREAVRDRLATASLARLNNPDPDAFEADARFALDFFPPLTTRPDQIKALRQTILNLAARGKLVPQDAKDKQTRLPPPRQFAAASGMDNKVFEQFRSLVALPFGWQIAPLAQLAENIVDCPHTTPKWTESGEICIRTNQLRPRFLDLSEPRYVSPEAYFERIERLEPKSDDILYSREGGILGIACRVPPNVRLCLGQRLMLIRPGTETRADYLEIVLNSPVITEIAKACTTGGAAPRVNMSTVRAYPIPLPPLAEQRRIVAKVDTLMTLCDKLEASLTSTAATRHRLLDALLAEALAPAADCELVAAE